MKLLSKYVWSKNFKPGLITHHCCHWFFSPIFCVIIPNALGLSAFPALRSLLDSQSSIETISDMALTNIRLINSAGFFSCFARTWLPDTADTVLGLKLLLLFFTENEWKKKSNKNLSESLENYCWLLGKNIKNKEWLKIFAWYLRVQLTFYLSQ